MNWPLDNNPTAFGVYVLSLGLLIGGLSLFYFLRGLNSRWWPTIEAQITTARLDEDSDGQFSVEVEYAYSVNGENYTRGETLTVWLPTRENAARVLHNHPVGRVVPVRYNPSRPSVAVLEAGISFAVWMWLIIGVAVTALGVGMLSGMVKSG